MIFHCILVHIFFEVVKIVRLRLRLKIGEMCILLQNRDMSNSWQVDLIVYTPFSRENHRVFGMRPNQREIRNLASTKTKPNKIFSRD